MPLHRIMIRSNAIAIAILFVSTLSFGQTQRSPMDDLAQLIELKSKVSNPDTRTRVDATHRVWMIGVDSPDTDVKIQALQLLAEPINSASDHIRMPAVYAAADIASSTMDARVKIKALEVLHRALDAGQVPIRDAAIDAVNIISASGGRTQTSLAAVQALSAPIRSSVNGVRIPAINALVRAVSGSQNEAAYDAALDVLSEPLNSSAMIGGMEVRMMAVVAMERIGVEAPDLAMKAKVIGTLRSYVTKSGWEPEAQKRAQLAALTVEKSAKH